MEFFKRNDCVPVHIDFSRFDEGSGPAVTVTNHAARWNKSCRVRFNKAKFKRAKRLSDQEKSTSVTSSTSGNRVSERVVKYQSEDTACFFCDLPAKGKLNLHEASTFEIDAQVRRFATDLQDTQLLAGEDMIALETKYHSNCLSSLYNKHRQFCTSFTADEAITYLHGIAVAELFYYYEDVYAEADISPVFRLIDIAKLYQLRLKQLGIKEK